MLCYVLSYAIYQAKSQKLIPLHATLDHRHFVPTCSVHIV